MEEQTELSRLAQVGYEAYASAQGWKAYNGENIPVWGMVRPDIRAGWETAVEAILAVKRS